MTISAKLVPRGTRAFVATIMDALDVIPETDRRTVFKHAAASVKETLTARAEKGKAGLPESASVACKEVRSRGCD